MLIFFEWTLAHTGGNEGLKSSFKKTKLFKIFFYSTGNAGNINYLIYKLNYGLKILLLIK